MRARRGVILLVLAAMVAACSSSVSSPTPAPTEAAAAPTTAPSPTVAPITAPSPTPEPTPTPAPTIHLFPFSVLVQLTDSTGAPPTVPLVVTGTVPFANGVTIKNGADLGDGAWMVNFGSPAKACILVQIIGKTDSGNRLGGPLYTISRSGTLLAISSNDLKSNPKCALAVTESPREVNLKLPAMSIVSGKVTKKSGSACKGGYTVTATKGRLEANGDVANDGSFAMYLTRTTWSLNATSYTSYARTVTVGAKDISGVKLSC